MAGNDKRERRVRSGSCARCRGALDLASVEASGVWYCSAGCRDGAGPPAPASRGVPAARLDPAPRRFYGTRRPSELDRS